MTSRIVRSASACALLLTCSCLGSIIAANRAREVAAVEWTLRNFNAALTRGDTTAMRSLVRPDFRLIEDSVEYDLPNAVTAVATAHAAGTLTRQVADLKVEAKGPTAWATYHVHATFASGRDTLRFSRLESAVLQKIESQWTIAFMTSSPTAPQH
jgi:ketosteroid isomerase-like protein